MNEEILSREESTIALLKISVVLFALIASFSLVYAADIRDVSVNPGHEVWMSQNFNISGQCNPAKPQDAELFVENLTIIDSSGGRTNFPDLDSDEMRFDNIEGILRNSEIDDYLLSPGYYIFDLKCRELSGSGTDSYTRNFTAKKLELSLAESFSRAYTGTTKQIALELESQPTGGNIRKTVDFSTTFEGEDIGVIRPTPYFRNGEWFLNLSIPEEPGEGDINIVANHKGASSSVKRDIDIEDPVRYDISLDSTQISSGGSLTWRVDAGYKGEDVEINLEDVKVNFDGEDITEDLNEEKASTSNSRFKMDMPQKEPGNYTLEMEVDIGKETITEEKTVVYPSKIEGSFKDGDSDISFVMEFIKGGKIESTVEGQGEYSAEIEPGEYDVKIRFPDSKHPAEFRMDEVEVEGWDNPFSFSRHGNGAGKVEGMILEALYGFENSLDSSQTRVRLGYTSGNVRNPENVEMFRCRGWNNNRETCYNGWESSLASFDRVKNEAYINVSSANGAFALGKRDKLFVKYSVGKNTYDPSEEVEVTGIVKNGGGEPVYNATVLTRGSSAQLGESVSTNKEGRFDLTFSAPVAGKEYDLDILAFKPPYRRREEETSFKVVREPNIDLVVPDEIKVEPNSSRRVNIYIKNTGFASLDDITLNTEDIPFLQLLETDGRPLGINQTKEAYFEFEVPPNVSVGTQKAELRASFDGKTVSEIFGVTVEEENKSSASSTEKETSNGGSSLTGNIIKSTYEDISPAYLLVIGLLIQGGIVAFFVARNRSDSGEGGEVSGEISSIKSQIEGDNVAGGGEKRDGVERPKIMQDMSEIKENIEDTSRRY